MFENLKVVGARGSLHGGEAAILKRDVAEVANQLINNIHLLCEYCIPRSQRVDWSAVHLAQ